MDKEFLKKCWKNPRWHSLMVLIIWIISLSMLMGIVAVINRFGGKKENVKVNIQNAQEITYAEKWDLFLSSAYEFTYTITNNEEIIRYIGTCKEGIITGYRERKDGIIKYSIEDDIVYENVMNEKNKMDTLYENVEERFLNPISLYEIIQNVLEENIDILQEKERMTYEYMLENYTIKVTTNEKEVTKITVTNDIETYVLDFKFID